MWQQQQQEYPNDRPSWLVDNTSQQQHQEQNVPSNLSYPRFTSVASSSTTNNTNGSSNDTTISSEILYEHLIPNANVVHVKFSDVMRGITYEGESQTDESNQQQQLYSSSVKSFERLGLSQELLNGVYQMGFSKPSKIQATALPLMLRNPPQNLIAQSQSGTGKSAAFILAMLSRIDQDLAHPQAICLTPSRELTRQIQVVAEKMARYTRIKTRAVIKDSFNKKEGEPNYIDKKKAITEHVIIGTPGTIQYTLKRRNSIIDTTHIKVFILDEADNMLHQDGLKDQSLRIKRLIKSDPQVLLFSATFPNNVVEFAHKFAPNPNEITLRKEELNVEGIKQLYMDCTSEEHKYIVLCNIYDFLTVSQSIIFCKLRSTANKISKKMIDQGHNVNCIHGGMDSGERDQIIDDFRRGEFKVLITTNLISRGIDISQVTLVVNYDLPLDRLQELPDPDVYLHRIGRTGRFGRIGCSIIFVHNHETYNQMKHLEENFGITIERVPTEDWEEVERILKDVK